MRTTNTPVWHYALGNDVTCIDHGTVQAFTKGEAERMAVRTIEPRLLNLHQGMIGSVLRVGLLPQCSCCAEMIGRGM